VKHLWDASRRRRRLEGINLRRRPSPARSAASAKLGRDVQLPNLFNGNSEACPLFLKALGCQELLCNAQIYCWEKPQRPCDENVFTPRV